MEVAPRYKAGGLHHGTQSSGAQADDDDNNYNASLPPAMDEEGGEAGMTAMEWARLRHESPRTSATGFRPSSHQETAAAAARISVAGNDRPGSHQGEAARRSIEGVAAHVASRVSLEGRRSSHGGVTDGCEEPHRQAEGGGGNREPSRLSHEGPPPRPSRDSTRNAWGE